MQFGQTMCFCIYLLYIKLNNFVEVYFPMKSNGSLFHNMNIKITCFLEISRKYNPFSIFPVKESASLPAEIPVKNLAEKLTAKNYYKIFARRKFNRSFYKTHRIISLNIKKSKPTTE